MFKTGFEHMTLVKLENTCAIKDDWFIQKY